MAQNDTNQTLVQGTGAQWLERATRKEPISKFGALVEMLLALAALVVFNLFLSEIGIWLSATDPQSFIPILLPGLRALMPWLNVAFGLSLLLAMAKFAYGRWTIGLRWAELGVSCVSIYVLVQLISGGPILAISPHFVAEAGSSVFSAQEQVMPIVNMVLKGAFGLALLVTVITTVVRFALLLLRSAQETAALT